MYAIVKNVNFLIGNDKVKTASYAKITEDKSIYYIVPAEGAGEQDIKK